MIKNVDFLASLKELVRATQAFEQYSSAHVRSMGLTVTQFDVLATLGNQPPMTCKELGDKTLVTKGTLTGVLDRLEAKQLITRVVNTEDARSQKIGLTTKGQKLFEKIFPEHVKYLGEIFNQLSPKDLSQMNHSLKMLREAFEKRAEN